MKRLSILLVTLFAVAVCANLPAAGNPGNGNNGGGGGNGGKPNVGVLDPTEEAELVYMREEEKLARDVYIALYDIWDAEIFSMISESEQRHMNAMLRMLNLYGIEDPADGKGLGEFTNPDLGLLYTELVAQGSASLPDAYAVGVYIEEIDIVDLQEAIAYTDEFRLDKAYGSLLAGAYAHLNAFLRGLNSLGVEYESEYLDLEDFEINLGTACMGGGMFPCGEPKSTGSKGPNR